MLARVSAAKSSSPGKTADPARKAARAQNSESFAEEERPRPEARGKFSWNIGNIPLHPPDDRNQPNSGEDGSSGAKQRAGFLPWPIQTKLIQAKLEVGAADDPLEREADRVAAQVLRVPDTGAGGTPAVASDGPPGVQRKCSCGGTCAQCRTEHGDGEHGTAQRKAAAPQISSMGASTAGSRKTAPPIVQEALNSPGQPLNAATRAFFEPRFAYDLSRIRVHADDTAARSARAVNARAYTVGDQIVFGTEQYSPETADGKRLLAHELTHTIQQASGSEESGAGRPGIIRSASGTRVMCDPPHQDSVHPAVIGDIQAKFDQLYAKLSPKARYRLYRNITIAIGAVTEEDDTQANSPRLVYTLSGNASSKEIDAAADEIGLTRWKPSARAPGRGDVGAPNDAEQLLTEGAETNHYKLWAAGVNRTVCADCEVHMEHEGVQVQAFPDRAFRKGGSLFGYTPPPAANDPDVAAPPTGGAGQQNQGGTPAKTPGTGETTDEGNTPPPGQGGTKAPTQTGGTPADEGEGQTGTTATTPAQKAPGTPPATGGGGEVGIQIATGVVGLGLGWLSAYLKAKVDQKIAQEQIAAWIAKAKTKINDNPDEALKKMMFNPDGTLYAWVHLDSSVITTFEANTGPEPTTSSSAPMIDLGPIEYQWQPVDQSMVDNYPRISGGGRHITMVRTIMIDLPLKTPPVEQMIEYATKRNLPMNDLLDYALYRQQRALLTYQSIEASYQKAIADLEIVHIAFEELQRYFKIAQKTNNVELQKSIAEKMQTNAQGQQRIVELQKSISAQLPKPLGEAKYWKFIADLIQKGMPKP
ncbi:MAG TPA: DUF4157 domain-containing protein [Acidobacteriaceae bacterium]